VRLNRFWNSKVLGAASSLLIAAFIADMVSLEMFRPRTPLPESGFVLAQGTRIGSHFMTWYVSGLDLLLELTLLVASMATIVACFNLRRRGR
jgi:hypothetical protein